MSDGRSAPNQALARGVGIDCSANAGVALSNSITITAFDMIWPSWAFCGP